MATIDRLFITVNAVNVDQNVKVPDRTQIVGVAKTEASKLNPENALVRMQFIELLFRIANEKYRRTDAVKTYSGAFVRLLEDNILPNWKMEIAQDFRD